MFLLFLGASVALLAAVIGMAVQRHLLRRRAVDSLRRRLASTYPVGRSDADLVPLRAPDGRVAAEPDGLHLDIGSPPNPRVVPWGAVESVMPVPGGRFVVHVARVGEVVVPGVVGARIWELSGGGDGALVERARPARV